MLEGGAGLGWALTIWEFFPDTKKSHVYPTKQRENLDSCKFGYIFVFLIYEMVEKVAFH